MSQMRAAYDICNSRGFIAPAQVAIGRREQAARLYHWAKAPTIPADNNRAERELRPLVIARKISFGSQSEQGAQTREILMSVLHTLAKRTENVFGAFKEALDVLAENEKRDPYKLLFDSS